MLGPGNRHWFRAKFHGRYRLFFRFSAGQKIIIYAWVNDEQSLRKSLEVVAAHLNVIAGQNTQLLGLFAEESAARSASAVSQRAITEAQEYNRYAQQWQEQSRIRQRYQQAVEAAQQRWNSVPTP